MEAVGRLAGGVAHDFNNLLTVIARLHARCARASCRRRAGCARTSRDIRQAVERGAALTRQLLAFGRQEVHAPARVDLHDVVAQRGAPAARALHRRGLELTRRSSAGDSARRPIRTARAGAGEPRRSTRATRCRTAARSTITTGDTSSSTTHRRRRRRHAARGATSSLDGQRHRRRHGRGRPSARCSSRSSPPRARHEGTGLGLATVYGIVQQNGGGTASTASRARARRSRSPAERCREWARAAPLPRAEQPAKCAAWTGAPRGRRAARARAGAAAARALRLPVLEAADGAEGCGSSTSIATST